MPEPTKVKPPFFTMAPQPKRRRSLRLRRRFDSPPPKGWLWVQGTDQYEFAPIKRWRRKREQRRHKDSLA